LNTSEGTKVTVLQTLVVQFMSDGSLTVKLSGVDGINARKQQVMAAMVEKEVDRQRAIVRCAGTMELHKRREETKLIETKTDGEQNGD